MNLVLDAIVMPCANAPDPLVFQFEIGALWAYTTLLSTLPCASIIGLFGNKTRPLLSMLIASVAPDLE